MGNTVAQRVTLRAAGVAVAALALLATGCGNRDDASGAEPGSAPIVVATTGIWADVTANVDCEGGIDLRTLVPAGADPHRFEPSLADRALLDDAVLMIANGLALEESLLDTLDAVEQAGTPVFRAGDHVSTIAYGFRGDAHDDDHGPGDESDAHDDDHDDHSGHEDDDGHDDHGDDGHADHDDHSGHEEDDDQEGHAHDHSGDDPHVWFDPQLVSGVLDELGEQLVSHAGLDSAAVGRCIDAYQEELSILDTEIAGLVESVPEANRLLVTNHDALGYFAERYGFEVIGTVIPAPTTLAETNPAQLEGLAQTISEHRVAAIFAESQHSDRDARALASRVGDVEVVTLFTGALGPDGSGAEDYLGFMRTNARLIADALG